MSLCRTDDDDTGTEGQVGQHDDQHPGSGSITVVIGCRRVERTGGRTPRLAVDRLAERRAGRTAFAAADLHGVAGRASTLPGSLWGLLEPDARKRARPVLSGAGRSNAPGLPGEHLGHFPVPGREWRPKADPVRVEDHSFFSMGPGTPRAIPYGVYDVAADTGWVSVGVDHDTSAFAVASIRRWWQARGSVDYPHATRRLITADSGGSNSYRYRLWKAELAAFAAESGLSVTVCHFPPGTSKWNKIEHRLFAQVTMNWRGRPLTNHEVVVATIATTRTRTGMVVDAELDPNSYPLGIAVTRQEMLALPIPRMPTTASGTTRSAGHTRGHHAAPGRGPRHRPRPSLGPAGRSAADRHDLRQTSTDSRPPWLRPRRRRPRNERMSSAADPGAGHPVPAAQACSAMPTGSWSPSCTSGKRAHRTCSPTCSGSTRTPSGRSSPRSVNSSPTTAMRSCRAHCASPRRPPWAPSWAPTTTSPPVHGSPRRCPNQC